jgi:hypothetical protein
MQLTECKNQPSSFIPKFKPQSPPPAQAEAEGYQASRHYISRPHERILLEMSIALSRFDLRVAQQMLHLVQRSSAVDHLRRLAEKLS